MADGLRWARRPLLRDPLLVAAFEGWNDAGDAASAAAEWLVRHSDEPDVAPFATIDPDAYVDYQSRRPRVEITDGVASSISWPEQACFAATFSGRDVVVLRGIEPNLEWKSFCDRVLTVARETGCDTVVTLGALLGEVPHTRPVRVTGTSNDADLVESLHLVPSRYEGPTGIVGVLTDRSREAGFRTISLWAPVPHYVAAPPNPPATRALLARFATVADLLLPLDRLDRLADAWRRQVDAAIADNDELTVYVRELEARVDADDADREGVLLADEPMPTADELVDEVERFLREQGDGDESAADDAS